MNKSNASQSSSHNPHTARHAEHEASVIDAPVVPQHAVRTPDDLILREAYERVAPEFGALTPEQLAAINLDVFSAVEAVLDAWPRILAMRPRLAALGEFDIRNVDKLPDYARALWYADQLCDVEHEPHESLPDLGAQASSVREGLLLSAQVLSRRGWIPAEALASLRGGNSYSDIAQDVISLVLMFRKAWSLVDGHTDVTVDELDAAVALAHRLAAAVGRRDNAPATPADAIRNRQRAFTLFLRAYERVRRAVGYLCAETGDADTIVPSIFSRGTHYTSAKPAQPAAPAAAPVAAPAAPTATTPATTVRTVPQDDPFGRS